MDIKHKIESALKIPEAKLSMLFGMWSRLVATHAWKFVIASSLIAIFLCTGLYWLQTEKDIDVFDVYFPKNGPVTKGMKKMKQDFPVYSDSAYYPWQDAGDYSTLSMLAVNESLPNIMQADVLAEIAKMCKLVEEFNATYHTPNGDIIHFNYSAVCAKEEGSCLHPSVCLNLERQWDESQWNIEYYPDLQAMISEPRMSNKDKMRIVGGRALRADWFLRKENDIQRSMSNAWVRQAFDQLYMETRKLKAAEYHLYSMRMQLDEWGSIFEKDARLFGLTAIFMAGFSILASSQKHCVTSRSWLAMAALLTTLLSISTGISILSIIGVPLIQVAFVTPFIILGVGIDGAFVMMFTWAKLDRRLPPEQRVGDTLQYCFVSIFISNLTSLLAFTCGSLTPYMAVNMACYYLVAMICTLTFYELTFFTGCLALHNRRIEAHIYSATEDNEEYTGEDERKHGMQDEEENEDGLALNWMERGLNKWLPSMILRDSVRVLVLILVGTLLAVAVRSTILMEENINEVEYQPDNSRIRQFYYLQEELFKLPHVVALVIDEPIPYWDPEIRKQISELKNELENTHYFQRIENPRQAGPNWLDTYESMSIFIGIDLNIRQQFISGFHEFTNNAMQRMFKNDVIFSTDNSTIEKSRIFLISKVIMPNDCPQIRDFFANVNPILEKSNFKVYMANVHLSRWERNASMKKSIWISLSIAMACCLVVMLVLLSDLRVIVLSVLTAACSMVSVLGFMGLWGITYNMSTYIEVLLLIGLCVDYVSHSGHAYLRSKGSTSKIRAKRALEATGVPLINAALSSLVGILMLGFSSSWGIRMLFVTTLFLFSFSFFYGVVVLPILLSFFGPSSPTELATNHVDADEGCYHCGKKSGISKKYVISQAAVCSEEAEKNSVINISFHNSHCNGVCGRGEERCGKKERCGREEMCDGKDEMLNPEFLIVSEQSKEPSSDKGVAIPLLSQSDIDQQKKMDKGEMTSYPQHKLDNYLKYETTSNGQIAEIT